MKKLRSFLKIFLFVQLGACAGRCLFICLDYRQRPGLYEMNSAPWYTGILLTLIVTAAIVLITSIIYFLVDRRLKSNRPEG